ncbi:MAG: zinc-binding dehydrogenase [Bacteroidales bacterium]|nr:zinc-binding dehydrogenase [Bacteroidales bacterium]
MLSVFLEPGGGRLMTRVVDVPRPGKGEVLIKVHASPVNPTDLAKIKEMNPEEAEGFIPGTEGSGMVVATGAGILPRLFKGKRVAFAAKHRYSGAWAEYVVTPAGSCFPISKKVSDEQASMAIVNPMTALAFLDYARQYRQLAVVSTVAGGALGRMVTGILEKKGIRVLNIVRSEKSMRELREGGAREILSSETDDFAEKLAGWCQDNKAGLILDAIGGEFVNRVIDHLPPNTVILLYGNLSQKQVEFMPQQLLRKHNGIVGFFLGEWVARQGMLKTIRRLMKVNRLLKHGMETKVQATFSLQDINKAIEVYEKDMSGGKAILMPKHE